MHLLPNNRVFVHSETTTRIYNYRTGTWENDPDSKRILEINTQYEYSRTNPVQGTSVILPFKSTDEDTHARVMIIGGGGKSNDTEMDTPATDTCEVINFNESEPVWKYTNKMNYRRVMPDVIILPNGKILVVNGCEKGKSDEGMDPVLIPELYDPIDENWTKLSSMNVKRLYHSTGLLMPDGGFITAGTDKEWNRGNNIQDEYRIDVFTPSYTVNEFRPEIKDVKPNLKYNEEFKIDCDNAEEIVSVVMIRSSSVTHSLNTDQRYIQLNINNSNKLPLTAETPGDQSIAPAGY